MSQSRPSQLQSVELSLSTRDFLAREFLQKRNVLSVSRFIRATPTARDHINPSETLLPHFVDLSSTQSGHVRRCSFAQPAPLGLHAESRRGSGPQFRRRRPAPQKTGQFSTYSTGSSGIHERLQGGAEADASNSRPSSKAPVCHHE